MGLQCISVLGVRINFSSVPILTLNNDQSLRNETGDNQRSARISRFLSHFFWIPNSKPLDSGFSKLKAGFQIPDSRFQIPDSRFQIPDSRFHIPDSRIQIPDSRFQIPDSRFQIPECLTWGK